MSMFLAETEREARLTMLTDDILEQSATEKDATRTMELPESDFSDEQDDEELQGDKLSCCWRLNPKSIDIPEILQKTRAMGETKVVDLSSSLSSSSSVAPISGVRPPPGLRSEQIKCTQKDKDSPL
jgi:hypothetical protein